MTLDGLTAADNLWVSAPKALATAQAGGRDFLVLSSAASSSLTVMEIDTGGALGIVDHLLDDRGTRFASATALEVARVVGRDYVIAGGSDDSISVFLLQENGRLLPRAHIADAPDLTLANVGAITARGDATGIDIVVVGSEPGLTRLHFEIGPAGETRTAEVSGGPLEGTPDADFLIGGASADQIEGGAGDDIIHDGAGRDVLTGEPGADTFILTYDRTPTRSRISKQGSTGWTCPTGRACGRWRSSSMKSAPMASS